MNHNVAEPSIYLNIVPVKVRYMDNEETIYARGGQTTARGPHAAREHVLKLCHIEINTTGGLKRRKSGDVLAPATHLPSTKRR